MKIKSSLCRSICFFLALILIAVPVYANNTLTIDMSVNNGCHSFDAKQPMLGNAEEISNVQSAFLYDYPNETLIYALNPDLKQYPSSLVKILTGLIIAETAELTDEVTVSEETLATIPHGSLNVKLKAGEVITMENLLYCILVESANDAAAVAAVHVCGSQEAFVQEMNRYAQELGCKDTNFTNVHGLHDENQYSTARDLARILAAAAKNETFMKIFTTVKYTVPATNMSKKRELSTSNFLVNDDTMTIYLDSRVTGGRTGVTETGERNLAVTAERNGVKLVSIVLGSESVFAAGGKKVVSFGSFEETSALLDMGFKGHHAVQLFYKNQALKQYDVVNGESYVSTGVLESVDVLLPYGVTYDDLSYRYNEDTTVIKAPVKKGDAISTVQVWYNNICLSQTNLYALHDVNVEEKVTVQPIQQDEVQPGLPTTLTVVIVIVCLLLLILFGRRLIFRVIHSRRVRRNRKNRRRSH